ncbi:MAG: hypothetical protein K8R21_01770 [Leptospira sp.]|nr:hypothetical protein [Leptospira sp.]
MINVLRSIIILLIFASPLFPWDLEFDRNDVKVFSRNYHDSGIREFKAITWVHVPVESLIAVLQDSDSYIHWMDTCIVSRVVKKVNFFEQFTYMENKSPPGITNRDFVIYSKLIKDKKTGVITIYLNAAPEKVPEKPEKVRIKNLVGSFQFIPFKNHSTGIQYQLHLDPDGYIPNSMGNASLSDLVYQTVQNLRVFAAKKEYQGKTFRELN